MQTNAEIIKKQNYFVAKDNDLITKSRFDLSMQQQKILLYCISQIKPMDDVDTVYTLDIKEFARVCGYLDRNGYYYTTIKRDIKSLFHTSCWVETSPGTEELFTWINTVSISKGAGTITITFHETIAPYLFALREKYTQYNLSNILSLSRKYSIRLYELLAAMRYKKSFEIPLEELKKRTDAETYDTYSNFEIRVLRPAVEEIGQMTDISVTYEAQKTGKKVTSIIFTYQEKNVNKLLELQERRKNQLDPDVRKKRKADS